MSWIGVIGACQSSFRTDDVMTADEQRALTPDDVIADLRAGNDRFVEDAGRDFDWLSQARSTASGQYPKAVVLSCLDSRVVPELIFDQGIGDLFVGRVAGNFENEDQLGSMEFGTELEGAKLIVVLGHTSCGAVKGAIDGAELGHLTATIANIEPVVERVSVGAMGRTSKDIAYVNRVVEANVRQTVEDIVRRSDVIARRVSSGRLRVAGAVYDLSSGRVRWLDDGRIGTSTSITSTGATQ
jgi:carbonic anhydrase